MRSYTYIQHCMYSAKCVYTHGLTGKLRTTSDIAHLLKPLEEVIQKELLLALTGSNDHVLKREIGWSCHSPIGCLGLSNPTTLDKGTHTQSSLVIHSLF